MEVVVIPYKQINTPKRKASSRSNSFSRSTENSAPSNIHGGLSIYPPSLSASQYPQINRQPPLLPLPIHLSLPSRTRNFPSSPPKPAGKAVKSRDQSRTPKKSKSEYLINVSTTRLGPDPIDLQMDISMILSPSTSSLPLLGKDFEFSGSVLALSPHPSSLPLPKFSVRSKHICCNVEATDNLRRLLRLR